MVNDIKWTIGESYFVLIRSNSGNDMMVVRMVCIARIGEDVKFMYHNEFGSKYGVTHDKESLKNKMRIGMWLVRPATLFKKGER